MRAARYHGRQDIRIDNIPVPEPGPGECLIEVEWCGICGTDLHEYLAGTRSLNPNIAERDIVQDDSAC